MSTYNATMTAYPWAAPNVDLENPHYSITVEWTWPSGQFWSRFQIVRSIRSSAKRVEEGTRMLPLEGWTQDRWEDYSVGDDYSPETRNPIYRDEQPPPGEWVYYTLFVLDANRVWTRVAFTTEIGPDDHDWALRLPELLPGVSINDASGVAHPADQHHDLVQFLQVPGTYLDIGVTMAEAVQHFWDPIRVPPQLLPGLVRSWGYRYDNVLGMGRHREIMAALRDPVQGSMNAVSQVASAAMGSPVDVSISNNLMLDVNDSSFEDPGGLFTNNHWGPIKTSVDMVRYDSAQGPTPELAPNLITTYYIKIRNATGGEPANPFPRTYKCGYEGSPLTLKPRTSGIPVSTWTKFRMGCYAYDLTAGGVTNLTMGMDFYDHMERYLGTLKAFGPEALSTDDWNWHGNGDDDTYEAIDIVLPDLSVLPTNVLDGGAANWAALGAPTYSAPQSTAPVWTVGTPNYLKLTWATAPTTNTGVAFWGVPMDKLTQALEVGSTYHFDMSVHCPTVRTEWRMGISDGTSTVHAEAAYLTGGQTAGETITATFDWTVPMSGTYWFGVEAKKPGAGWSAVTDTRITAFTMKKVAENVTYGVPWFTVTDECCLDLIVVDDG